MSGDSEYVASESPMQGVETREPRSYGNQRKPVCRKRWKEGSRSGKVERASNTQSLSPLLSRKVAQRSSKESGVKVPRFKSHSSTVGDLALSQQMSSPSVSLCLPFLI